MYAKTLGGQPPVPGLVSTTRAAAVLLPQLLQRGWAALGEPAVAEPGGGAAHQR